MTPKQKRLALHSLRIGNWVLQRDWHADARAWWQCRGCGMTATTYATYAPPDSCGLCAFRKRQRLTRAARRTRVYA